MLRYYKMSITLYRSGFIREYQFKNIESSSYMLT